MKSLTSARNLNICRNSSNPTNKPRYSKSRFDAPQVNVVPLRKASKCFIFFPLVAAIMLKTTGRVGNEDVGVILMQPHCVCLISRIILEADLGDQGGSRSWYVVHARRQFNSGEDLQSIRQGEGCVEGMLPPFQFAHLLQRPYDHQFKGIAMPTCISVDHCICHYSPLRSDPPVILKNGQMVKVRRRHNIALQGFLFVLFIDSDYVEG